MTKCKGLNFKANIDGTPSEGKIQVENGKVYLCQDKQDGEDCQDKLGFMYSWTIGKGSPEDMKEICVNVTDFEIVPRDQETYQDWQVGDRCYQPDEDDYIGIMEVIFRSGELVVLKDENNEVLCMTVSLMKHGNIILELTDIERQIIEERKKSEWKPQDGDICYAISVTGYNDVFIYKAGDRKTEYYASSVSDIGGAVTSDDGVKDLRPATEEEKQQLFDAMAKRGKRWNAEKKVVEDIPKPHEFKKGEPVLVRNASDGQWAIATYLTKLNDQSGLYLVTDGIWPCFFQSYVIPYNEKTMHLLGTKEDYKEE